MKLNKETCRDLSRDTGHVFVDAARVCVLILVFVVLPIVIAAWLFNLPL